MTATVVPASTFTDTDCTPTAERTSLWKPGLKAGLVAALATTAVAGVGSAAGVSLEVGPEHEAIPVLGFGQMTLLCTVVGLLVARAVRRFAGRPAATWTKVAVGLTAASFVPDLTLQHTAGSTVALLMATHVVAAALVIPAVTKALPTTR